MIEFIGAMVLQPGVWGIALGLAVLCAIALEVRSRFGRYMAGVALVTAWVALATAGLLLQSDAPQSMRYLIYYAATVAAGLTPIALFALVPSSPLLGARAAMAWLSSGIVGGIAVPLVAIYSVCALGIDCL